MTSDAFGLLVVVEVGFSLRGFSRVLERRLLALVGRCDAQRDGADDAVANWCCGARGALRSGAVIASEDEFELLEEFEFYIWLEQQDQV